MDRIGATLKAWVTGPMMISLAVFGTLPLCTWGWRSSSG
jgi:hypothetical protein